MNYDTIKQYVEAAYTLPGWALSWLLCIVFGYVLRRIKSYPNGGIPLTCVFLGSILTMLLAPPSPIEFGATRWRTTNLVIGGLVGFAAWLSHRLVLNRIEDKFPTIKSLLDGNGQTKPDEPNKP